MRCTDLRCGAPRRAHRWFVPGPAPQCTVRSHFGHRGLHRVRTSTAAGGPLRLRRAGAARAVRQEPPTGATRTIGDLGHPLVAVVVEGDEDDDLGVERAAQLGAGRSQGLSEVEGLGQGSGQLVEDVQQIVGLRQHVELTGKGGSPGLGLEQPGPGERHHRHDEHEAGQQHRALAFARFERVVADRGGAGHGGQSRHCGGQTGHQPPPEGGHHCGGQHTEHERARDVAAPTDRGTDEQGVEQGEDPSAAEWRAESDGTQRAPGGEEQHDRQGDHDLEVALVGSGDGGDHAEHDRSPSHRGDDRRDGGLHRWGQAQPQRGVVGAAVGQGPQCVGRLFPIDECAGVRWRSGRRPVRRELRLGLSRGAVVAVLDQDGGAGGWVSVAGERPGLRRRSVGAASGLRPAASGAGRSHALADVGVGLGPFRRGAGAQIDLGHDAAPTRQEKTTHRRTRVD